MIYKVLKVTKAGGSVKVGGIDSDKKRVNKPKKVVVKKQSSDLKKSSGDKKSGASLEKAVLAKKQMEVGARAYYTENQRDPYIEGLELLYRNVI